METIQKEGIVDFFTKNQISEDVSWVLAHPLEPYVYTQLPASHPQKTLLYPAYLASITRHQLIKSELYTLLQLWYQDGFEVMLYKGFYLSEWVYPRSGQRVYIDVDVIVHEDQWVEMSRIAQRSGLGM